jgi:hypothetical protein
MWLFLTYIIVVYWMLVKAIRQVCIAPFSMASSVIAASLWSLTSTSFSYNIEGLGKLGKEFGTMLLLTPAVREGDVLCILKS